MSRYLTIAEYRSTSTGQDTNNLVPGGNAGAQDAELDRKILAAGGWIDSVCSCSLVAARRTDLVQFPWRRNHATLQLRNPHLNAVTQVQIGARSDQLSTISIAGAWIEDGLLRIPTPDDGSLQLSRARLGGRLLARVDYVPGWANTVLVGNVAQGATTIVVADPSGFVPMLGSRMLEDPIRIIDGSSTETVVVQSVAGSTLTLAAPLAFAHTSGTVVSGLPADVKEAAVMATSAHLRHRSSDALVVAQNLNQGAPTGDGYRWKLLRDAEQLLDHYRRVR